MRNGCGTAYWFGDYGEHPDKTKCGDTIYSGIEDDSDGFFLCPMCTAKLAVEAQEMFDRLRWRKWPDTKPEKTGRYDVATLTCPLTFAYYDEQYVKRWSEENVLYWRDYTGLPIEGPGA